MAKCQIYNEKNSFAFWIVIILLFSLALGNLCLTLTITGILKIYKGMENIELIQGEETSKFYGNIDFDRIYKRDGKLEGFHEEPMEITGNYYLTVCFKLNLNILFQGKMHLYR